MEKSHTDKYQFLWYTKYGYQFSDGSKARFTYVKAKNIESACKKFHRLLPCTIYKLDYEVKFNDTFIDIRDNPLLNEFI